MLKLPISLLLLFLLQGCKSNGIRQYVRDNTITIRTIEPDALDFTDLQAIGDAIGEARVVMLGEQDHGDAPTFLAKTRLIKYLHEQKGFNVLAFESDFYALNKGWDRLSKQEDSIKNFLSKNIFSLWTQCVQCEDLFYAYIPATHKTTSPLQVTGFDNQNNGAYSYRGLRPYVDSFIKSQNIPFIQSPYYNDFFLPALDSLYTAARKGMEVYYTGRLIAVTDTILHQLNAVPDGFSKSVIQNTKAFFEQIVNRTNFKIGTEIRDLRMARNLEWLVKEKYRGEKVIVWAANYHILKGAEKSFHEEKWQVGTMGGYFTNDSSLASQTYILGFTSNNGMAGRLFTKPYEVEPPKKDGFESWIDSSLSYAFVDFKKYRQMNKTPAPFYMKGIYLNTLGVWTDMFDGVFYIRDMYPCQKRN